MSALAACASVPQLLRSIGFSGPSEAIEFQELVVEDAPRLERLLPLEPGRGPATIRVMRASKLEKVGLLSAAISKLEFGTTAFQVATNLFFHPVLIQLFYMSWLLICILHDVSWSFDRK